MTWRGLPLVFSPSEQPGALPSLQLLSLPRTPVSPGPPSNLGLPAAFQGDFWPSLVPHPVPHSRGPWGDLLSKLELGKRQASP